MSAPILVACGAATLALALPVVAAAGAAEAVQRAAGAADAAALAAADALSGWIAADPCELASSIAQQAGAVLERCDTDDARGEVRLKVGTQTMFGTVYVRTRAGPPVP